MKAVADSKNVGEIRPYYVGETQMMFGEFDKALKTFNRAIEAHKTDAIEEKEEKASSNEVLYSNYGEHSGEKVENVVLSGVNRSIPQKAIALYAFLWLQYSYVWAGDVLCGPWRESSGPNWFGTHHWSSSRPKDFG